MALGQRWRRENLTGKERVKNGLRRTYAYGVEEDFVEMEKDTSLLLSVLLSDERKHRVVSTYGMGGLDKSTLAKKIFHHEEIRREFKGFAWVCVSQDFKPKIVFQDLLKQLLPMKKEQIMAMGESELVEEVYKMLKEQKCLVVVDDIWNVKDWKILCPAFPTAETQSKTLITTRKESVAKAGFAHPLGLLSEGEGWELLQKKAFKFRDPKDLNLEAKSLEHLGRQMVQKCGYLPLAISVVGGILSEKNSFDAWEKVNKNIDLYLTRGNGSEGYGAVMQVLSLSYDDLPYHLKACFLCLSNFPEDETIDIEQLYMWWIAEGIVSLKDQEKEDTLMDVAERYLGELANRSMVQVELEKILAPEKIKYCRLHDLLRDTCVATSAEEEFLNVIDFRDGKHPSVLSHSSTSSLRRLAIYMDQNIGNVSFTRESTRHLRSLLCHVPSSDPLGIQLLDRVIDFKHLKFLRVLKFENIDFEGKTLPEELSNLIHLRFLGFRGCHLIDLPSWIGDFPFLQTLDLRLENSQSCKIPNVIRRMKRLRYLYLPYHHGTEEKLVFFGLDELEILEGFNSEFCDVSDLSKLKSLRHLEATIYGNDNLSKFIDCIEVNGNSRLETMVSFSDCNFSSEEGKMLLRKVFSSCTLQRLVSLDYFNVAIKLPEYELGFFPKLAELFLSGSEILEDPMATLEKLPKLRRLYFRFRSITGMTEKWYAVLADFLNSGIFCSGVRT